MSYSVIIGAVIGAALGWHLTNIATDWLEYNCHGPMVQQTRLLSGEVDVE